MFNADLQAPQHQHEEYVIVASEFQAAQAKLTATLSDVNLNVMSEINFYAFTSRSTGEAPFSFCFCSTSFPGRRASAPPVRALAEPEATRRALARVDAERLDLAVAEFMAALGREGELAVRTAS